MDRFSLGSSLLVNQRLTEDEYDIPELINELRTNYPLVSAILEKGPEMDWKKLQLLCC